VAEALTRSQDEADRERKRLEAAFAEKLERERAAIRKEALERIAAAERAAREAAVPPVAAGAPPPEPREGAPAPKTDAPPPKAPLTAATDPAPAPAGAGAVDSAVGSPETAAAPASEAPPDPVMVAMAAIGPDSKPRTVPDDVARGIVPPSRRVGDYWVFQRELRDGEGVARRNYVTLTVNAVRPDGFELEASDSAVPFRFDAAGNLYSMPAPRGGGTIVVDPVDPLFRYPLEAGASWSARTREILPGFAKDADSTVTVKGWEEVQVAAGTFRALKISKVAAMAWEPFPGRSMNSRRVSTVWFVPGVGHYARYEVLEVSTDGAVLLDQTWELDSFKLN